MKTTLTILLALIAVTGWGQTEPEWHWSIDNTLIDSMLTGDDLTASGGAIYDASIKKWGSHSGQVQGTNDYYKTPTIDLGSNFIISLWARSDNSITSSKYLLSAADSSDVTDNLQIRLDATNLLKIVVGSSSAVPSSYIWTQESWNHVFVHINDPGSGSAIVRLYINGGRITLSDSTVNSGFTKNIRLNFGVDHYINGDFDGNLDEIRIYKNVTPTQAFVDSVYNGLYRNPPPTGLYTPVADRHLWPTKGGNRLIPSINGKRVYFKIPDTPEVYVFAGINQTIRITDYDGVCPSGSTRDDDADCAVNDFSTAPLLALVDSNSSGYNKIYIDPDWTGDKSGTLAEPYDALPGTLTSGNIYLFKKGTTYQPSASIEMTDMDNVAFGAYGISGDRPVIAITVNNNVFKFTNCENITIRDLQIQNPQYNYITSAGVQLYGGHTDIYNCDIRWQHQGIRTGQNVSYRAINCEIHDIFRDALSTYSADYIEIAWCNIHDINTAYYIQTDYITYPTNPGAAGDGLELGAAIQNLWFHNTIMDRSNAGNKACFMLQGYESNIVIEYCLLGAPLNSGISGQSSQILNADASTPVILLRNNLLRANMPQNLIITTEYPHVNNGASRGLYGLSSNDSVIGNVFVGFNYANQYGTGSVWYNNTFYDNEYVFWAASARALGEFRNNILYNNTNNFYNVTTPTESNNLYTDPSFVDAANNNFRLNAGSNAIDAGATIPYRLYDIEGTPVPQNTVTDIGAYEYEE